MSFSTKELSAIPKKPSPTVGHQCLFVRDHQRHLRLVIDLLEQELHRQHTPIHQAKAQVLNHSLWALAVTDTTSGGQRT